MFPVERIVEEGLCTGCGLCASLSPALTMEIVASGYERPVLRGSVSSIHAEQLSKACPALHLRGLDEDEISLASNFDEVWGPYESMAKAYAADPEVRHLASTGGVLTAISLYLLDAGLVDFICHVKPGGRDPTFGQGHISKDKIQVLEGAGSRYGPAAPLEQIAEVLNLGQPFAFVGKPCDISALRGLGQTDPRVGELVRAYLTPVCGGSMPPKSMNAFLAREANTDRTQVERLRYRGHGCPGKTRVETRDGRAQEFTYEQFWGTDSTQWHLPWRCKICPDGIGDAADIAAADDWPNANPDMVAAETDPGTNAMIVRTKRGAELLAGAVKAGFLTCGQNLDPRYMDSVQPHQMRKKINVSARWAALPDAGRLRPQSTNLRLETLSARLSKDEFQAQKKGLADRIAAGKAQD